MFYCINPNYRYQFFSPDDMSNDDNPFNDSERNPVVDDNPANEPKHNLVNALAALYRAYGGEEELKNNAVGIIYKIADVISGKNNTPDGEAGSGGPPSEAGSGGPPSEAGSGGQKR